MSVSDYVASRSENGFSRSPVGHVKESHGIIYGARSRHLQFFLFF